MLGNDTERPEQAKQRHFISPKLGNPGNFCLWNLKSGTFFSRNPESWTLESEIQFKESRCH